MGTVALWRHRGPKRRSPGMQAEGLIGKMRDSRIWIADARSETKNQGHDRQEEKEKDAQSQTNHRIFYATKL
jgi:hypothetical protein